jgi:hypothetical protein
VAVAPREGSDLASKLTGPETRLKLLRIGADCDPTATRAAALDLQQADELAMAFAESHTKRLTGATNLIRPPDTSRSLP